ncbi:DUF1292 domain-containing protein [Pseudogracilibacillus sp. ICA-222130]|uniref:DUF1292 domain-containing protein n=1 Tax=Pseudogracilibacillus sp. ICA-222130 TaxID=3134655 RepID=UPI0030BD264E
MSLEPNERITIPDENGEEHLFEVLTQFDIEENGQSYIAVIPVEQSDDEEVDVFAFRYEDDEKDENQFKIFAIEDDAEWDLVEETLNTVLDDGNNLL